MTIFGSLKADKTDIKILPLRCFYLPKVDSGRNLTKDPGSYAGVFFVWYSGSNMNLKVILISLSIVLNICLICVVMFFLLQGTPEIKDGRYGILKKDIEIGRFNGNSVIFKLPKGLMVRDASATGADWFEPNRFRIVLTSDKADLIDYSISQKEAESKNGEYYSVEKNK